MSVDFEECLEQCIKQEELIISKLSILRNEVEQFHTSSNAVKTAGTTLSAFGTGVFVGSVVGAPFTGGLSLSVAFGAIIYGGVISAIPDVFDHFMTKDIIKNIKNLVDSREDVTESLNQHFKTINEIQNLLVKNGIKKEYALLKILEGVANRTLRIYDETNVKFFIRFFTTIARVQNPELLAKGTLLAMRGLHSSLRNVNMIGKLINIGTKTSRIALKTFGRVTAVISVGVTLAEVGLLIKDWKSDHLTVKVIDEMRDKLEKEKKQLEDIQEYIKSLKLTVEVTKIDGIPIVATNHDLTEISQALSKNKMETFTINLKNYGIDFSIFKQEEFDNILKFVLDKLSVKGNSEQLVKDVLGKYRGITAAQTVKVFLESLLNELEDEKPEKKERSQRGEHVINNNVINVYKEIIDLYVWEQYQCSFKELTRIPSESDVYKSYHNPISETTENNIRNVMIAEIPSDYMYIDINAIIYGVAILFLRHTAKIHLVHIHNSNKFEFSGSIYTKAIRSCIDFMNNFDVYVDKVALEYWVTHNGGDRRVFSESRYGIQQMLEVLLDKMANWVIEISANYPD